MTLAVYNIETSRRENASNGRIITWPPLAENSSFESMSQSMNEVRSSTFAMAVRSIASRGVCFASETIVPLYGRGKVTYGAEEKIDGLRAIANGDRVVVEYDRNSGVHTKFYVGDPCRMSMYVEKKGELPSRICFEGRGQEEGFMSQVMIVVR